MRSGAAQNVTLAELFILLKDPGYYGRIMLFHFGGHADSYRLLFETAQGQPALRIVFLNGLPYRAARLLLTRSQMLHTSQRR